MEPAAPELELRQLRVFLVLAEELHFGRAADRLGIAQPPLSQQIRRLEQRVGHPLFERRPRGVTLTPAGHELLPAARQALDRVAHGLDAARHAGRGTAGRLRIGFPASLALTLLPAVVRDYREHSPGVHLDVHELASTPQLAALRANEIDVGFLRETVDEPDLTVRPVLREPFVVVLPADHPLAARRTVEVAALADEPFVLFPRAVGAAFHDRIVGLCQDAGFTPDVVQYAAEWLTLAAFVEAGFGVTIAPAGIARIRLRGVVHRRLAVAGAHSVIALCWRSTDTRPLLQRFVTMVRDRPNVTRDTTCR